MINSFKNNKLCLALIIVVTLFGTLVEAGWFDDVTKTLNVVRKSVEDAVKTQEEVERPTRSPKEPQQPHYKRPQHPTPAFSPENVPRYDSPWVREIQQRLTALGFNPGSVDGVFGGRTGNAIQAFERSRRMSVIGLPTPGIMRVLREQSPSVVAGFPSGVGGVHVAQPSGGGLIAPVQSVETTAPLELSQSKAMDGVEFSRYPEPDYPTLFKMYMAEHHDILDSSAMAMEYHLIFHSNKEECYEIRKEMNNEFYMEKLFDRVRPRFAKALSEARSWPRTAVFRLKVTNRIGKYDQEQSMFPLTGNSVGLIRIRKNNQELCFEPIADYLDGRELLPGQGGLRSFDLKFKGLEKLIGLPLPPEQAEAFLQSTPQRRVDIEVLVQTDPVPFRVSSEGIQAHVIAARLLNSSDGRLVYNYDPLLFRQKTLAEVAENGLPLTPDLLTLLAVRYMPDSLEGETLRELTENMIKSGGTPVFRPKQIQGREPKLASQELAPDYKAFVVKAAAQLPKRIRIKSQLRISPPNYDSSKGVFLFRWRPDRMNSAEMPAAVRDRAVYQVNKLGEPRLDKELLDAAGRVIPKISSFNTRSYPNISLLALDRWLEIKEFPMEPSQAEKLMKPTPYQRSGSLKEKFRLEIEFTVQNILPVVYKGSSQSGGILVASLDKATIFDHNNELFASLSPDTLPSAKEEYAAAQAQLVDQTKIAAAATAKAEEEKRQKAVETQLEKDMVEKKLMECESIVSAKDRLRCFEDFCPTLKNETSSIRNRCLSGRIKAGQNIYNEKSKAKKRALTKKRDCKILVRTEWKLNEGTEEYEAAFKGCMEEQNRAPYGPDILGLRLGMTWGEADTLLMREMDISKKDRNKYVEMANEPRPFKSGILYFSKRGDHGIAFYYLRNNNNKLVAAVSRRLYFDEKGQPADPIREALVEKYGPTDWSKGDTLLWVTAPHSDGPPLGALCSKLADKLSPVELSRQRWTSGEDGSPRTIFMIGAEGTPEEYSQYEACGPVLIARLNQDKNGKIKDMSIVLFDPSWIASLPVVAFKPAKKKLRF